MDNSLRELPKPAKTRREFPIGQLSPNTSVANGTEGWVASTRPAANNRTAAQKAKAKAAQKEGGECKGQKRRSGREAKAKAGVTGSNLADNGVLLTLSDVTEDSVVSVKTARGNFDFKLSDIPYGKYIDKLDGAVEVERTAASRQVSSDRKTDHDYPAAAVAKDGTTYITYTSFTPGIDRDDRSRSWDSKPGDLAFLSKAPGGDQLFGSRSKAPALERTTPRLRLVALPTTFHSSSPRTITHPKIFPKIFTISPDFWPGFSRELQCSYRDGPRSVPDPRDIMTAHVFSHVTRLYAPPYKRRPQNISNDNSRTINNLRKSHRPPRRITLVEIISAANL